MLGDHSLAMEDGSRRSLLGDHSLAMEDGSRRSLLGDPFPSNGGWFASLTAR